MAEVYRAQGRYSEAEPLYKRSLLIIEEQLGADHPDTATSLNNLALLYDNMGRYSEAEPLYKRALTIAEAVLGSEHPTTVIFRNNYEALRKKTGLQKRSLFQSFLKRLFTFARFLSQ